MVVYFNFFHFCFVFLARYLKCSTHGGLPKRNSLCIIVRIAYSNLCMLLLSLAYFNVLKNSLKKISRLYGVIFFWTLIRRKVLLCSGNAFVLMNACHRNGCD